MAPPDVAPAPYHGVDFIDEQHRIGMIFQLGHDPL